MTATNYPLNVVFLDRGTLSPETVLRELPFAHLMEMHERTAGSRVAERIREADIVITNKVRIGAEDIAGATRLKLVAIAATGTDNVDLAACAARGIVVSNVRNYAVHTVPEHTFALIFALRRSMLAYRDAVRTGRWQEAGQFCFFDFPIRDMHGSTLGVIGDGVLGSAVANIGRSLGMHVLVSAHKGRTQMDPLYTPFDEVIEQSDIITLHCPLNLATRDLIGEPEFARMKRKPLIVNTARGGLVNEAALVRALRSGVIAGAGFDVATEEPLSIEHPFHEIMDHPAFILTPHVAWASSEALQTLADQLIENIAAFVQGRPVNVVALN